MKARTVKLKQVFPDVHMGLYRGIDSLKRYLENRNISWGDGELFLFRNSAMNILIAFAPFRDGYAYKRLPGKERFDFSVRSRDDILEMFAEALGMRWVAERNVFEVIANEDAKNK